MEVFSEIVGDEHVVDRALVWQETVAVRPNRGIQVILHLYGESTSAKEGDMHILPVVGR